MRPRPGDKNQAAWYIAGIIDGEGHVSTYRGKHGVNFSIEITNTDLSIIEACQDCLDILEVKYTTKPRGKAGIGSRKKDAWGIKIARRDQLVKLASYVTLQSSQKQNALEEIINTPAQKTYEGDPCIEEIRQLYWESNMSMKEIGKHLGIGGGRVHSIMIRFGIPTRNAVEAWEMRKQQHAASA